MMEIEVKIQVSNVENWEVDWTNDEDKKTELDGLNRDIRTLISDHLGIYSANIIINSELNNPSIK